MLDSLGKDNCQPGAAGEDKPAASGVLEPGSVTLNESLKHTVPQFPHAYNQHLRPTSEGGWEG